jgi:hypothetical protein
MKQPTYESMHTVKLKDITAIDEVILRAEKEGLTYTSIIISYSHNGKAMEQSIRLKAKPSNLIANVNVWMFFCPIVNKTAYKLYMSDDGYLYHRERFSNAYYIKQTYSKKIREVYAPSWERYKDKFSNEIEQPHFVKYYNGKATKRYEYLQQKDMEAQHKNIKAMEKFCRLHQKILSVANEKRKNLYN